MATKESVIKAVTRRATRIGWGVMSRYRSFVNEEVEDEPARPWLSEYQEFNIAETLEPYPDIPLHQFLYDAASEHPDNGFIQRGVTVTYPEVLEHAERLATALAEYGVERGDRVATVLPTSVQFVVVDAAISIVGGVHVPNDFLDATEDLVYRLELSDPDFLIGHDEHEELLFELAENTDVERVILTNIQDYSDDSPSHEPHDEATWLPEVIDRADRAPPSLEFDPETDVHTLMFTGGTTGNPKGVQLTHRNIVANALQVNSLSGDLQLGSGTTLLAMPFYHSYGYTGCHARIEAGGNLALVDDARDVDRMAEMIREHGIRMVSGVPTQFIELLEEDVERNLIAISGSAPLADEVRDEFQSEHLGITQGYGLSEMSPTTHVDIRGLVDSLSGTETSDDRFDHPCIGIPVPDTEIKLVDVETDEVIPLHRAVEDELPGEMYLNGPQRMLGYLDRTDPFDDEGYIGTGDVVKIDPSGRFYVVDRVKNMVNVSGLKVYTEEVDEVLYELDGVRRPATVGVPDPDRPGSERVKIYIEQAADADLTETDVREHLEDRVPQQAMPIDVVFLEEIPLTDIGKIDKQALKSRHEAEAQ